MKNIFGTTEELKLTDQNGVLRYEYRGDTQCTYDSSGNLLHLRFKRKNNKGYENNSTMG